MRMVAPVFLMVGISWAVLGADVDPPIGTNLDITDAYFVVADEDGNCIDQGTIEVTVDNQSGGNLYAVFQVWDRLPLPGENHHVHTIETVMVPPGESDIEATFLAEEGGDIPLQEEYDCQCSLWTMDPETGELSPYPNFVGLLLSRRFAYWRE